MTDTLGHDGYSSDARRIGMRPAWLGANSYTRLLAGSLSSRGSTVHDVGTATGDLFSGLDIIVFHWPDEFFVTPSLRSLVRAHLYVLAMAAAKLFRSVRFVWIVHNARPHNRATRRSLWRRFAFLRLLDGAIFLSEASREIAVREQPALRRKPFLVIRHGHYKSLAQVAAAPPPPVGTRPVALIQAGRVAAYKAPDQLAALVAALGPNRVGLTITGVCREPALRARLEAIAADASNVRLQLHDRYLSDAEMDAAVDAADAVVLPYRDILNSGSALLALSRARPVVAPRLGSLIELEADVGPDWLRLYDGELDEAALASALDWIATTARDEPDLSLYDWNLIGERVARFLAALAPGKPAS